MVKDDAAIGYKNILKDLYDRYYQHSSELSNVTSSHWRKVGSHKVTKKNNQWLAEGIGFGDFREDSLINQVKYTPQKVLLRYLLKRHGCPKYLAKAGKQVALKSGRIFSYDCVKQVLSLYTILKLLNNGHTLTSKNIKVACVIGDGYGFFTALMKFIDPDVKVVSVNLGRTLLFDVLISQKCLPDMKPILLREEEGKLDYFNSHQQVFVEAENYNLLQGLPIDFFINIASMQEMDPIIIEKYFLYMRSSSQSPCYFYCCNRLKKTLPDGIVTDFSRYPWQDSTIFLDEQCPWYQKYPTSKPPFWRLFDGTFQHRFVRLK